LGSKLLIRLIGAPKPDWTHPEVEFDPTISINLCDGMLAWGSPSPEFVHFRGIRLWYSDEALTHSMWRTPLFKAARRSVANHEFLHHSNPDSIYRFPCVTHYGRVDEIAAARQKTRGIIAVVSNFGGRIWWFREGVRLRNSFILNPAVDLLGNGDSWRRFRRWPWSRPGPPPNYRGPLEGNWYLPGQVDALAPYVANACFENASVPYYFTEKFLNAVRAGCVPIYHAHDTVRETLLEGAKWIDPADFGFDVQRTLLAALDEKAAAIPERNRIWLQSERVKATEGYGIWSRIANLFIARITAAPEPIVDLPWQRRGETGTPVAAA
jgi:hypothetical protein